MEVAKKSSDDNKGIVISLRLDTDLAQEFRIEAARRGIRLKALFAEMWGGYRDTHNDIR